MFKISKTPALLGVLAVAALQAGAALITHWQFETAVAGHPIDYAASAHSSYITTAPTLSSSGGTFGAGQGEVGVSGGAMRYSYTGSAQNKGSAANLNGVTLTLTIVSDSGTFSGLSVKYDTTSSGLSSISGAWSYRIGTSGGWNQLASGAIQLNGNNIQSIQNVSFAPGQTLQLQFVLSGATGSSSPSVKDGFITFDNMEVAAINAVPEPVNIALGLFAVAGLGFTAGRRWLKSRKQ